MADTNRKKVEFLEAVVDSIEPSVLGIDSSSYLMRSKSLPTREHFIGFTFPFGAYLKVGDILKFRDATIEINKNVLAVKLIKYSEVFINIKNSDGGYRLINRFRRRDIENLRSVKRDYAGLAVE